MKRLLLLAILVCGCGGLADVEDYRSASPSRQGIDIKVPASGQALESDDLGQLQQAELGQQAELYKLTRTVTLAVNTGTAVILGICEAIVRYPATTLDANHAVWGPWTDSLSPNTYRFTVTRSGTGYDYSLEGKDKTSGDTAYVKLVSGHHEPGAAAKQGSGTFTADWDAAATLPEHGAMVGKGEFTYSRNADFDVTVGVKFTAVEDADTGAKVNAEYAFAKENGGDGSFDFVVNKNMSELPGDTGLLERLAIKSRWKDDGAGRSDVKASGGDIASEYTVSECWGATFLETYYAPSWDAAGVLGVETDCAFTPASYSAL